jgi:hypothetical protein
LSLSDFFFATQREFSISFLPHSINTNRYCRAKGHFIILNGQHSTWEDSNRKFNFFLCFQNIIFTVLLQANDKKKQKIWQFYAISIRITCVPSVPQLSQRTSYTSTTLSFASTLAWFANFIQFLYIFSFLFFRLLHNTTPAFYLFLSSSLFSFLFSLHSFCTAVVDSQFPTDDR